MQRGSLFRSAMTSTDSTGGGASSASMDAMCETLMLEEILPRLPPKSLLRLGATSRRYRALARSPGFATRYWRRAGAFLQPAAEQPAKGVFPRFLTAPACRAAEVVVPGADLAEDGMAIVHSAAGGLLLCSRGSTWPAARYFVCNPVSRQRTALPELRGLSFKQQCGLLTVAAAAGTDGCGHGAAPRFQVVVIEEWQFEDMFLGLNIFSSDTGRWRSRSASLHRYSSLPFEHDFRRRPALGQSGAAYWIQPDGKTAIAYDSASDSLWAINLPGSGGRSKRCIAERHGGGGLRYARADAAELEVWDSPTTEGRAWTLAHRVGITELLGLNADATWLQRRVKPVGFHPADVDVVFLALPVGVAAYSIEHGTMDLLCAHDCFADRAYLFPYVHPPCPVQIPAIQNSAERMI